MYGIFTYMYRTLMVNVGTVNIPDMEHMGICSKFTLIRVIPQIQYTPENRRLKQGILLVKTIPANGRGSTTKPQPYIPKLQ